MNYGYSTNLNSGETKVLEDIVKCIEHGATSEFLQRVKRLVCEELKVQKRIENKKNKKELTYIIERALMNLQADENPHYSVSICTKCLAKEINRLERERS